MKLSTGLCALTGSALGYAGWKLLLKGRVAKVGTSSGKVPRVELSWEDAMSEGVLSDEDLAIHYAPEVKAAVNTMVSCGGRGDFVPAVIFGCRAPDFMPGMFYSQGWN